MNFGHPGPGNVTRLGSRFMKINGERGINFAVFSTADKVQLLIFKSVIDSEPARTFTMSRCRDPLSSGWIYNLFLPGATNHTLYNYEADGQRLLDPYARALAGKPVWNAAGKLKSIPHCIAHELDFDWQGDKPLNLPLSKSIIYETLVSGFTGHHSSGCGSQSERLPA